jgi:hypothetical protein
MMNQRIQSWMLKLKRNWRRKLCKKLKKINRNKKLLKLQ